LKNFDSANLQNRSQITQAQAAELFNVSERNVAEVKAIEKDAPELVEEIIAGKISVNKAKKKARKKRREKEQDQLKQQAATVPASDRWNIFQGDIGNVRLEPNSIDAIITDPPYPEDCLPLWLELAKFAKYHLKPGGVLLAMTGNLYLPQILIMLGEHLTYQWQLSCTLPGQHSEVHAAWVNNQMWKPILVYRNGGDLVNIGSDLFKNDSRDKDFHEWGQGVDGYCWQIEHFTKPNGLICDPFLGGGTTAIAALQLKRRFVGFDIDPEKVAISKGRIARL
jgi:16S rRNA G966 N2-methylase RsmD